jgi:hypothetical protein
MIHATDHDVPGGLSRTAFGCFGKAAAWLVALVLVGVASQQALAVAITITQQLDLKFGRYATTVSQGGTVTINPSTGGKTLSGALSDLGDSHQRAQFSLTGDPDAAYSITLPSQITISSGANTMTVNAFTSSPSGSGVLDGTGNATLYVGATLTLSANQASGSYADSFSVTVDYQ